MVSVVRTQRLRPILCWTFALVVPFIACTLDVVIHRGTPSGSAALKIAWGIVTLFSGVPFTSYLPGTMLERIVYGAASVAFAFVICLGWGIFLSCAAFRNCL